MPGWTWVWNSVISTVFVTAALAILHFFWMRVAKNNLVDVGVYALVLATLVGWRILHALKARGAQRGGSP